MQVGDLLETGLGSTGASRKRQDGCGFAPALSIGTSSRQVLARSVLPESVFGFAFGDCLDLDPAIFTLVLRHSFLPFSSLLRLLSLLNPSRC